MVDWTIQNIHSDFPDGLSLDVPLAWRIYPVFHVLALKAFKRSPEVDRIETPPPFVMVNEEEEYEIEAILRHKGQGARRRYQVLWKGYPITEAS